MKQIQDGFLKDNVIHIPCVSELQYLVDLGGNLFFPPFDPGEKTLATKTHLGTTNIASRALFLRVLSCKVEGCCLLIYQRERI